MNWLPNLHKIPYKARFNANPSYYRSFLIINFLPHCCQSSCRQCMKGQEKRCFGLCKFLVRYLVNWSKKGSRQLVCPLKIFRHYILWLPHNLIKETLLDLIERTFKKTSLFWVVTFHVVLVMECIFLARVCSHIDDFKARNKWLTAELLEKGYRYYKRFFFSSSITDTMLDL